MCVVAADGVVVVVVDANVCCCRCYCFVLLAAAACSVVAAVELACACVCACVAAPSRIPMREQGSFWPRVRLRVCQSARPNLKVAAWPYFGWLDACAWLNLLPLQSAAAARRHWRRPRLRLRAPNSNPVVRQSRQAAEPDEGDEMERSGQREAAACRPCARRAPLTFSSSPPLLCAPLAPSPWQWQLFNRTAEAREWER